jgi:phospholipid transport system substrate-binding protein
MPRITPGLGDGKLSRRTTLLAAAGLLLVGGQNLEAAIAAADGTPQDFIQRLGDRTVAILSEDASDQQKLARIKDLLDQATDLDLVARLVMGRYWRSATEEQRREYVRLFNALLMQTMAERFSWYSGETFEIQDATPVDERDTMVATRILRPSGKPPIQVDWRVRQSDGRYLLIDIVAEGVSLVVSQRSEAAEFINRNGVDGLLQEMRNRLAKRDAPTGT